MTDHGEGSFLDFQRQLDEAFDRLIYRPWAIPGRFEWRPRLDLHETADAYLIEIDLPGVPPDRVEIRVAERELTVTGTRPPASPEGTLASHRERECGAFRRTLTLPRAIAPELVQAEYQHGTYRIRLIKRPPHESPAPHEPEAARLIRITIC